MKTYKFIISLIGIFVFIAGLSLMIKLILIKTGFLFIFVGIIIILAGLIGEDKGENET